MYRYIKINCKNFNLIHAAAKYFECMDTYRKNLVNKVGQFASRDWAILPIQGGYNTWSDYSFKFASLDRAILLLQEVHGGYKPWRAYSM
jgi:hypothetical protein